MQFSRRKKKLEKVKKEWKEKVTCNDERSDEGNKRNIGERALEGVSMQMVLEAVARDAREAGYQNARHHDVPYGHQHRQRRHEQRRHHRHHEEHRPHASPDLLQEETSLRHYQRRLLCSSASIMYTHQIDDTKYT